MSCPVIAVSVPFGTSIAKKGMCCVSEQGGSQDESVQ
jgi:hypothetical protein